MQISRNENCPRPVKQKAFFCGLCHGLNLDWKWRVLCGERPHHLHRQWDWWSTLPTIYVLIFDSGQRNALETEQTNGIVLCFQKVMRVLLTPYKSTQGVLMVFHFKHFIRCDCFRNFLFVEFESLDFKNFSLIGRLETLFASSNCT